MLCALALSLFFFSFSELGVACSQHRSCPARLQEQFSTEDSLKVVEAIQKDKEFQAFLSESSKQKDAVLESKEFHDVVAILQEQALQAQAHRVQTPLQSSPSKSKPVELTLFVSFSLGEKALLNIAQDAKKWNATLVLRGFKEGSYIKTAKALQKIIQKTGQGFIIDPELFTLFAIQVVPTFVLSKPFQLNASERMQTPLHDRIQGHVSAQYALETFAKEGDLKDEAKSLLLTGETK